MKKLVQRSGFACLFFLGLGLTSAQAQFQVGLGGNYLIPTIEGSKFSDGYPGGGLALRYFISPQLAIGVNGRYLTRTFSDTGLGYDAKGEFIVPGAQAEFFLTKSGVKPYVGVEANYFLVRATIKVAGQSESDSEGYFGAAPKVGVQFMFSPNIGLDVNAGYHVIFSEGETAKNILIGAGLVFGFGGN